MDHFRVKHALSGEFKEPICEEGKCKCVRIVCVCVWGGICWQKEREHLAEDLKFPVFLIAFLLLSHDSSSVTIQPHTLLQVSRAIKPP